MLKRLLFGDTVVGRDLPPMTLRRVMPDRRVSFNKVQENILSNLNSKFNKK